MKKLFRKTRESTITFCERCGEVCDERCGPRALRERALLNHAWFGVRV